MKRVKKKLVKQIKKKLVIQWKHTNPDQHSELDKLTENLVILKFTDNSYYWYETDDMRGNGYFTTIELTYDDAECYLSDYEGFEISKTRQEVINFFK